MKTEESYTPVQLFLVTLLAVFSAEVIVMYVLSLLPEISVTLEAILDGFLLSILVFPALYWLSFQPMRNHLRERLAGEAALRTLNAELEERVQQRTRECDMINEALRREIREKELAQQALKEHQAQVLRIVESFPDVTFLWDLRKKRCLFINSRIADFGLEPDAVYLMGETFVKDVLKPARADAFLACGAWDPDKPETAGLLMDEQATIVTPGGESHHCRLRANRFDRDDGGSVRSILCTLTMDD